MSTLAAVMKELKAKGSEKTRATYVRHGIPAERSLGISVADLKFIAKGLKGKQELAMELYATGMMEAMYLAGMVAKGAVMTRAQLKEWATGAGGMSMVAEYTVPRGDGGECGGAGAGGGVDGVDEPGGVGVRM